MIAVIVVSICGRSMPSGFSLGERYHGRHGGRTTITGATTTARRGFTDHRPPTAGHWVLVIDRGGRRGQVNAAVDVIAA